MAVSNNFTLGKGLYRGDRGVTLVELLVVMAIITILMSLLFPVIASVRKKGRIRATELLINSVDAAVKQYKNDFDDFPKGSSNTDLYNSPDKGNLYLSLCGPNEAGVTDAVTGKKFPAYTTFQPESLKKDSGSMVVIDFWGQPLYYFNSLDFMRTSNDPTRVHNSNGVDLFSTGPDKVIDANNNLKDDNANGLIDEGAELVDDITNFSGTKTN